MLKLTTDVVFKIFFSSQDDTSDLANFLSAALHLPDDDIAEITIQNPMLEAFDVLQKDVIVDLKVRTKNGKIIQIEMQVENHENFKDRITYYASRALVSQLKKGWDYSELKQVISIVIADFEMFDDENKYHRVFKFRDEDSSEVLTSVVEIHTLELPKTPNKTSNELELWLNLFKAKTEEECNMLAEKSPIINKAVIKLKSLSEDEKTTMLAEDRDQAIAIRKAQIALAEREGIEQGIEKGELNKTFEIAKNLLNDGLSVEKVSKYTNLTYEQIESLQKLSKAVGN